ncbi:hypothetical protein CPB86DRAFT_57974 [Serendipita vermifera]|nr:hypothetical protein CPB86DRAFT_57974 [Serendipita vermifera]
MIKEFLANFSQDITDQTYLPCLGQLHISGLWLSNPDLSYANFTKICREKRPKLISSGNPNSYDGLERYEGFQVDPESGEDSDFSYNYSVTNDETDQEDNFDFS